jgi:hypothetical protein
LYEDLNKQFGLKFLLTYRLNQDVLENFFGAIRTKAGLYDHPDPLEFRYRLRSYILGRNYGTLSDAGNTEEDSTPSPTEDIESVLLSAKLLSTLVGKINASPEEVLETDDMDELKYDSFEHLGGYICKRLKIGPDTTATTSNTWTDQVAEGGLIKPPEELMQNMKELENTFNKFNGDTIKITKHYLATLLNLATVECNNKTKKLFFRSRMFFRKCCNPVVCSQSIRQSQLRNWLNELFDERWIGRSMANFIHICFASIWPSQFS